MKGENLMKKILFVINNLEIGGVQSSLLNLIEEIKALYDVTILTFYYNRNYLTRVPSDIKIISLNSPFKYLGMSNNQAKKNIFSFIGRSFFYLLTRLFGRHFAIKLMSLFQKKLKGYDYAISFLHEGDPKLFYGGTNEFVLNKVESVYKVTWLHCDFTKMNAVNSNTKNVYDKFDKIVACSNGCKKAFLTCYPEMDCKTIVIRNCNNYPRILKLSEKSIEFNKDVVNILTVARLSEEKRIDRGLYAIKYCIEKGLKINYHIIGGGNKEKYLVNLSNELKINENVYFYGNQSNPYQYIKNADLLLVTSEHEAAPMVINEAVFLGVPILSTETLSSYEMITEKKVGIVCKNNQESITKALYSFLTNRDYFETLKIEISKLEFSNLNIIDDFKRFFN